MTHSNGTSGSSREDGLGSRPRHPIRIVASRTGVSPSALRAWERRYGVVDPHRTESGQRLYSDEDIERLSALKRATDAGRSIGKIADLSPEELRALVEEDEAARREVWREARDASAEPGTPRPGSYLPDALDAVRRMDGEALEGILKRAAVVLGGLTFTEVLLPRFLHEIGERWVAGELRPAHEHAASAVVRRVLAWLVEPASDGSGPAIVVGTLPGEVHELGALMAATVCSLAGWNVTYLGEPLPVPEIALAAREVSARVVGISTVNPPREEPVLDALRTLGDELEGVDILVGGAAAELAGTLARDRVHVVSTLPEMRALLADLDAA